MKWLLTVSACLALTAPGLGQTGLLPPRSANAVSASPRNQVAASRGAPHPAVARIIVTEPDGVSFGSGTLVDIRGEHGLVITNWHVVQGASGPIEVVFPGGFRSVAHVHKTDKDWDLAALAIWRPPVDPVPLSQAAPKPGDRLTIAGYGGGDYRTDSGNCIQYMAPGEDMPFEIVELRAVARQGDSGGPIFNERGELAGVLFGEGHGRTCGSHCLRVRDFLSPVLAGAASVSATYASAGDSRASQTASPSGSAPRDPFSETAPTGASAQLTSVQRLPPTEEPSPSTPSQLQVATVRQADPVYAVPDLPTGSGASAVPAAMPVTNSESSTSVWSNQLAWLNSNAFDVARNILAVVGALLLGRGAIKAFQKIMG